MRRTAVASQKAPGLLEQVESMNCGDEEEVKTTKTVTMANSCTSGSAKGQNTEKG